MSDCVNWKGYRDKDGYGRLSKPKEGERAAHRVAWVEAHSPIPPGMCVLHRCDNPPCINAEHLFLGTHRDNTLDMHAKGRAAITRICGELSPSHKLSTEQVGQIRKERTLGASLKVLSVRYAVGITTVWEIVQRRTWREVR